MAVAGSQRRPNPRAHSFCARTIQQAEPTVIADATSDPRVMSSPLAQGPHPIRFYAAHPIESPDGYRIGSFCIYDPEPREAGDINLEVLRDLALLAQAEITGVDGPPLGARSLA
jgi:GAF domain-containing protein